MIYWIGWTLCLITTKFFGRIKTYGSENVPREGGVILAPNHISYIDPPAAGMGINFRRIHFMAKLELFQVPVLGFLIKAVGAFPVRQHTADRAALKTALKYLENGELVCMFPEGTRSLDGKLGEPQAGLGMIVLKSKAPVVPCALVGTRDMLPPHSKFLHFARVKVVYGEPITFEDLYEQGMNKETIAEVGRRVIQAIADLQSKYS